MMKYWTDVRFISVILSRNGSSIFNQHAERVVITKKEVERGDEGKGEGRLTKVKTCSNAID